MPTPPIAAGFFGIEHFTPPWDVFFLPLFNGLVGLYELLFSDFALAIIVFTIAIRTILAPLFVRQIRSQREMQRMQPLIREVQRKYKSDRQKMTEETMALYREHGVNPAAGCLPLILQLPILFALYQALIRASSVINFTPNDQQREPLAAFVERTGIQSLGNNNYLVPISGACDAPPDFASLVPLNCQLIDPLKLSQPVDTTIGWLFGLDLAQIDRVFSISVFGGFVISGLAILAAVLQFVQVKMTQPSNRGDDPTAQATATMIYLFPLMTILWGGIFPSGLILYWIVYTSYLIVQQFFIMGWGNLFPIFGWTPAFGPRVSPSAALQAPSRGASEPPLQAAAGGATPSIGSRKPATVAASRGSRRSGGQKRRRGREARKR